MGEAPSITTGHRRWRPPPPPSSRPASRPPTWVSPTRWARPPRRGGIAGRPRSPRPRRKSRSFPWSRRPEPWPARTMSMTSWATCWMQASLTVTRSARGATRGAGRMGDGEPEDVVGGAGGDEVRRGRGRIGDGRSSAVGDRDPLPETRKSSGWPAPTTWSPLESVLHRGVEGHRGRAGRDGRQVGVVGRAADRGDWRVVPDRHQNVGRGGVPVGGADGGPPGPLVRGREPGGEGHARVTSSGTPGVPKQPTGPAVRAAGHAELPGAVDVVAVR